MLAPAIPSEAVDTDERLIDDVGCPLLARPRADRLRCPSPLRSRFDVVGNGSPGHPIFVSDLLQTARSDQVGESEPSGDCDPTPQSGTHK